MTNESSLFPLWPFFIADALLVGTAFAIFSQAHRPWLWWEALLITCCGAGAAGSLILPFLRRAAAEERAGQAETLSKTVVELQRAEQIAAEISGAAGQWSQYQEQAARSAAAAAAMAETISAGTLTLSESLRKAGDADKNHLRLEIDKLRRAEGEWLQVVVRILDHVYALYQAAQHSGQPALAEQMEQFQNSCRELALRTGLAPAVAAPGTAFDAQLHQLPNNTTAPENAVIAATLATGFTYQGQLLRRALVSLQAPANLAEH